VARRKKPDIPPGAARRIAEAIEEIDAPKPRKALTPSGPRTRSNPNDPVPGGYQRVGYGTTTESQIAQAARLKHNNQDNVYGGMSMDYNGRQYSTYGRSGQDGHAENDMLDRMRQRIGEQEGVSPDEVDLRQGSNANVYVEFSPCDTRPRYCQDVLRDHLPPGSNVSYSWPWQPRSARGEARDARDEAIATLFQRGTPGPT
jgi:hypothetical protein